MLRTLAKQLANHGRRIFEGIIQRGEQGVKANPRNKDLGQFGPKQVHIRNFIRNFKDFYLKILNFLIVLAFQFNILQGTTCMLIGIRTSYYFQQNSTASQTRYFVRVDVFSQTGQRTWLQKLTGSSKKTLVLDLRTKVGNIFQNSPTTAATQLQARIQELLTGRKLISLYALVGLYMKAGIRQIELEDEQFDHICHEIKVNVIAFTVDVI